MSLYKDIRDPVFLLHHFIFIVGACHTVVSIFRKSFLYRFIGLWPGHWVQFCSFWWVSIGCQSVFLLLKDSNSHGLWSCQVNKKPKGYEVLIILLFARTTECFLWPSYYAIQRSWALFFWIMVGLWMLSTWKTPSCIYTTAIWHCLRFLP